MAGPVPAWQRAQALLAGSRLQTLAGMADQGVVSLGNLGAGLLVLRLAAKEDYGLYSICYMTIMILTGFAGALFAAQMTVSYYDREPAARRGFVAAVLGGQLVLGSGFLLLAALAAILPDSLLSAEARLLALLTLLACPGAMAHDFFRSYCFVVTSAHGALALDLALVLLWLALTLSLQAGGLPVHVAALAGYGLGATATSVLALAWSGLPLRRGAAGIGPALRGLWQHGRWAIGGVAVTALQNSAYVYLLGWFATARAVADLNAARMLLAPMNVLVLGVHRTLLPHLARLLAEGRAGEMRRQAGRALAGLLAVIAVYGTVLVAWRDTVIGDLLGGQYRGIGVLVALWTVVLALQAIDTNLSAMLQARKRFRFLAVANLWTAIPVVVGVVPMILLFGAAGSLVTLAGGVLALVLLLWRDERR